jgi:hypothetical protein
LLLVYAFYQATLEAFEKSERSLMEGNRKNSKVGME